MNFTAACVQGGTGAGDTSATLLRACVCASVSPAANGGGDTCAVPVAAAALLSRAPHSITEAPPFVIVTSASPLLFPTLSRCFPTPTLSPLWLQVCFPHQRQLKSRCPPSPSSRQPRSPPVTTSPRFVPPRYRERDPPPRASA